MARRCGNILVRGGTIVHGERRFAADVRICSGRITAVEDGLEPLSGSRNLDDVIKGGRLDLEATHDAEVVVDASGSLVFAGLTDPQVHFRDPGHPEKETFTTGSLAALAGGITGVLDMPNTKPATTTSALMSERLQRVEAISSVHHGLFAGATPDNLDELQKMVGSVDGHTQGMAGVCGTKVFMGSSTGDLLVDGEDALNTIMEHTPGLVAVHAEDEDRLRSRAPMFADRMDIAAHAEWRDDQTALLATQRAVTAAEEHAHRLHVLHLTSAAEVRWLRGRTNDLVSTEALPQHLTFDDEDVLAQGTRLKMNPPIRYAEDRDELWRGLHDGTIACLATDHAPHGLESKQTARALDATSGMPGVETSLPVMMTHASEGRCTQEDIARWMAEGPALVHHLEGRGRIQPGFIGDLCVVDPEMRTKVSDDDTWSKVGWNPWAGRELVGWPVLTVVEGVPAFSRRGSAWSRGDQLLPPGSTGGLLPSEP